MKTNVKHEAAVLLGRLAGKVNKKKGRKYFSDLGKAGAKKRWEKASTGVSENA